MKFLVCFICAMVFSLAFVQVSSDAELAYNVAVVYSYDYQDMRDNKEIKLKTDLIRKSHPNARIVSIFLNYNKQMSEQVLHQNAASAFRKIEAIRPDLTIVYDNIAFEHVAVEYLYPHRYNTLFLNVWKDFFTEQSAAHKLSQYGKNVNGVLLSGDAQKFSSIMCELDLQNLYIVKNDERYYAEIATNLAEQMKPHKVETFDVKSTVELAKTLRVINGKPKGMVVFLLKNLTSYDESSIATPLQIATIILELNTTHFELSYLDNLSRYGVASSDILTNRPKNNKKPVLDVIITERINNKKGKSIDRSNDFIINIDRVKALGFDRLLSNYNILDGTDESP